MSVFAGHPKLVCLCVGVHWRTLLMSLFLLPHLCSTCIAHLSWFVSSFTLPCPWAGPPGGFFPAGYTCTADEFIA